MGCCSITHDKYGIRIDYNFNKKEPDWGINNFGENGSNSAFFEKLRGSSRTSPKNSRFKALNQEHRLLEEQRPNGIDVTRNYPPGFCASPSQSFGSNVRNSNKGEGNRIFGQKSYELRQGTTPERLSLGQPFISEASANLQQAQSIHSRQNYHMNGNHHARQQSSSPLNYSNSPVNHSRVVQVISPTREEQGSPKDSEASFLPSTHSPWDSKVYNYSYQQQHFSQPTQIPANQQPTTNVPHFRSIPYTSNSGVKFHSPSNNVGPVDSNTFMTPSREGPTIKNFSTIRVDPNFSSNGFSDERLLEQKELIPTAISSEREIVKKDIFQQELDPKTLSGRESFKNQSTNRTKADTEESNEKDYITLTINLLGDSIKDNFVLQKIMEIFPEACHLPSFDTENNRVKFQIKMEEFERNPKLQELLWIAERKSAGNMANLNQEAFDCAESFIEAQNISFSKKNDDTFGNNDNRNLYPEYLHESFRENGRADFLDTVSYEVRKDENSQNSNFDMNLDESADLAVLDSNPFRKDGGKRRK